MVHIDHKQGRIDYNGISYSAGESFNVEEFFINSYSVSSSDFHYIGEESGLHTIKIKFVTNHGTVINRTDKFYFQ